MQGHGLPSTGHQWGRAQPPPRTRIPWPLDASGALPVPGRDDQRPTSAPPSLGLPGLTEGPTGVGAESGGLGPCLCHPQLMTSTALRARWT